MHEQLNHQSDVKLRRGGLITNLTIRNHQLKTISNGLLQFSYANILYQLNDLRYLHVINGTLKHIDQRALALVEQALEHFDVSFNELQQMPRISDDVEQHSNLLKLTLSHNQIYRLTLADLRPYHRLQDLDLSFNRLQYVDMSIINNFKSLKRFSIQSNSLKTLTNNVTFPSNFHLKFSSNPLECDCRLRWLRNALNRLEYPIYHDEAQCETPKALAEKSIVSLGEEQFVCGPILSKPDLSVVAVISGERATLRCDVYSDPAPDVWWTFQNKIIGRLISTMNEGDIHAGSFTIRSSCLHSLTDTSTNNCLNKTTTLTISNINPEHNGTYNCVAAIRNQGRSDNEYLSYELRVRRSSSFTENSFFIWTIGLFVILFLIIVCLLCFCWLLRCRRSNDEQSQRNKTLLFDSQPTQHGALLSNGNFYGEKFDEPNSFLTHGSYDPYDMIDSRSQLGPPMYSEVRLVDSTPLKSVTGGSVSSTLVRRQQNPHDSFYETYRSDRQIYEPIRPSPLPPVIVDDFEDEMIFPTGYEENYEYREDIMKPNQMIDVRRQMKFPPTNHDRSSLKPNGNSTNSSQHKVTFTSTGKPSQTILNSSSFDSDYQFDRSESQYAGLVESQL